MKFPFSVQSLSLQSRLTLINIQLTSEGKHDLDADESDTMDDGWWMNDEYLRNEV